MKRLFYLLLLCLPFVGTSQPMTFNQMNVSLNKVSWPTPQKLVAVGISGVIYTSNDGGETWAGSRAGAANFNDVSMADANTGWAVGTNGLVLKTTDGGITWVSQTSGTSLEIRGVHAVSPTVAYICGGGGGSGGPANSTVLFKTTNGGTTWAPVWTTPPAGTQGFNTSGTTLYSASLNSVFFLDANTGYAAGGLGSVPIANGGGGKVLKTTDGGATWTVSTMPSTNFSFRSVHFADATNGFAVGNAMNSNTPNNFWKTTDGGATWTNPNGFNMAFNQIRATSPSNLFIATGAGTNAIVRRSTDGGTTWANDTLTATVSVMAGVATRDSSVFSVGGIGMIYKKTGNGAWAKKNGGITLNGFDGFFTDANNGYVACAAGRVAKTTDGGDTWAFVGTPTTNTVQSVWFTGASTGFAVCSDNAAQPVGLKTTDGGNSWAPMGFPTGGTSQFDIFFADPQNGWSCGASGTINRTTDGGNTWTAQTSGVTNTLNAVHFVNATTGWVVGLSGRILKTTDGGTTWALQTLPGGLTTTLFDVWFASPNTGFVCGASGKAFRTLDGGTTWTELITGTTFFLNDLEFFDDQRGILAGTNGTMLFTADGGNSFSLIAPPLTSQIIQAVWKVPGTSPTTLFFSHILPFGGNYTLVEATMNVYYPDADGDGFGATVGREFFLPAPPSGYVLNNTDCNDSNPAINPNATETCNSTDDDCDGQVDEGLTATYYADADGDTFGNANTSQTACTAPSGFVANDDDCNDSDAAINPAATEICYNSVDENCDGQTNEGCAPLGIGYTVNASCTSGTANSITVNALGGNPPFQYSRNGGSTFQSSPTFTGLSAGTYNLVVKDANNLTAAVAATINGLMALSTNAVQPLCAGGTGEVAVAVAGGYPAFSYAWARAGQPIGGNTATILNAPAGSYRVTVTDDKGCTRIAARILGQPTAISVSGTRANVTCNGGSNGSINLTASGGTGSRTFLWNDGATTEDRSGLSAGVYTCTVTDANGCTRVSPNFNITQPTAINLTLLKTDVSCFDGSNGKLRASASGGVGTKTYQWSNGASTQEIANLPAGSYTVTATDAGGCTRSASATVTQPASAVQITNVISAPSGSNYRVTVTASGGTPAYKYKRSVGGGAYSGENGTGIFTNVPAGTYEFIVRDAKNCTDTIVATIPTTLLRPAPPANERGQQHPATSIDVFPNPAHDILTIVFDNQTPPVGTLTVLDMLGQTHLEQPVNLPVGERATLPLDRLTAGTYTIRFTAAGQTTAIKNFVVVK